MPWETKCKVSNYDFMATQLVGANIRIQYRIELPIVYTPTFLCSMFKVGVMPFFESRLYGGRENYPFDFFETRFRIYGVNLQLIYEY